MLNKLDISGNTWHMLKILFCLKINFLAKAWINWKSLIYLAYTENSVFFSAGQKTPVSKIDFGEPMSPEPDYTPNNIPAVPQKHQYTTPTPSYPPHHRSPPRGYGDEGMPPALPASPPPPLPPRMSPDIDDVRVSHAMYRYGNKLNMTILYVRCNFASCMLKFEFWVYGNCCRQNSQLRYSVGISTPSTCTFVAK